MEQTVRERAEELGIKIFDTAMPQPWVDEMTRKGFDPRGVVVWSYDGTNHFGGPAALTTEAADALQRLHPGHYSSIREGCPPSNA